jgi:hypothetical protein
MPEMLGLDVKREGEAKVSAARATFVKAIQDGKPGYLEYHAWRNAKASVEQQLASMAHNEREKTRVRVEEYTHLRNRLAKLVTGYPHQRTSRPEMEAAWIERASKYIGREITDVNWKDFDGTLSLLPVPEPIRQVVTASLAPIPPFERAVFAVIDGRIN